MSILGEHRAKSLAGGATALLVAAFALSVVLPPTSNDADREQPSPDAADRVARVEDAGPDAALRMVDRLQLFQTGNAGTRLVLDASELTALLRHAIPGMIPHGVTDPTVLLVDDEVWVRATVSPEALPGGAQLRGVLAVVPDAVAVRLRGRLLRPDSHTVEYRIDRAEVEGLALPPGVVGRLVRGWPGGIAAGPEGEPTPAIRASWPIAQARFEVVGDRLVIERPEPNLLQSVDGSGGA